MFYKSKLHQLMLINGISTADLSDYLSISKKTLRIAVSALKGELEDYEASYNGDVYTISSNDKNGDLIDSVSCVYGYEIDTRKKAMQFAEDNLAV